MEAKVIIQIECCDCSATAQMPATARQDSDLRSDRIEYDVVATDVPECWRMECTPYTGEKFFCPKHK